MQEREPRTGQVSACTREPSRRDLERSPIEVEF
jgi:hypothetical protein